MPRTSRTVAQRLAAQSKSRKRRLQRAGAPSPAVAEVRDDAAPGGAERRETARATVQRPGAAIGGASKPVSSRRPYSEYGAEYAYVLSDLRRILVIAGSLLLLLVILSFFVQ
jgi:hypothetical protein